MMVSFGNTLRNIINREVKAYEGRIIGSRTKTPRTKTPGHKPPDKNPLDKNPPCQKPPRQKPPRQNILFRNFITFVFRMSYGKEISIWFLAVKYVRYGSIK